MASLDTELRRRLDIRIDERIADVTGQVTDGSMDEGHYKHQCGYLRALREVKQITQEIESLINEGK